MTFSCVLRLWFKRCCCDVVYNDVTRDSIACSLTLRHVTENRYVKYPVHKIHGDIINFYLSSCIFLGSHWLIVLFHSPWIFNGTTWVLNFECWSLTFFLQPFDSSSDTQVRFTTVQQITKSSTAKMVSFWDRNQCKQSNGTAERNLVL